VRTSETEYMARGIPKAPQTEENPLPGAQDLPATAATRAKKERVNANGAIREISAHPLGSELRPQLQDDRRAAFTKRANIFCI